MTKADSPICGVCRRNHSYAWLMCESHPGGIDICHRCDTRHRRECQQCREHVERREHQEDQAAPFAQADSGQNALSPS